MTIPGLLFWTGLMVLFYCYIGYGLLLYGIHIFRSKKQRIVPVEKWPEVTLVIASYNEEKVLVQKINNTLQLDYPADKLKVIVVTDGSTDGSLQILAGFPQITTLHTFDRMGKAAALNWAMRHVQTPLVIFSDANTVLNTACIKNIVSHFSNQHIGAVAGEKKVIYKAGVGKAESLYWQYESFIKKMDAGFGTVIGAAGELFALRSPLFTPLADDIILDDFMLSLNVSIQGYKIAYEPDAYATEMPSVSLDDEEKRKVRIAAGAFQVLDKISLSQLLAKPVLAFQFFSHKWLRWVVCPIAIVLVFLCNFLLVYIADNDLYKTILALQIAFYTMAIIGWALAKNNKTIIICTMPLYFLFMNYCIIKGMVHHLFKKQTVLWPQAQRQL